MASWQPESWNDRLRWARAIVRARRSSTVAACRSTRLRSRAVRENSEATATAVPRVRARRAGGRGAGRGTVRGTRSGAPRAGRGARVGGAGGLGAGGLGAGGIGAGGIGAGGMGAGWGGHDVLLLRGVP